jgi:hypothetical protein
MELDLRYPIGRYAWPAEPVPQQERSRWIEDVRVAPALVRAATAGLDDTQLDTPYRPGGWSVRQVAHHLPDSHVQAFIRFKLALTEDQPTIKAYFEDRWATLADSAGPIEPALSMLEAVHLRWLDLMAAMQEADWSRTFFHPERKSFLRLDATLGLYAWHGKHHAAQVTRLREREGW